MQRIILLTLLLLAFPATSFAGTLQSGSVDLASDATLTLNGAASGDESGSSVAAVGDVNGDGIGDTLVGARYADPDGKTDAGSAYVAFGTKTKSGSLNLGALGNRGFRIDGAAAGDLLGARVAPAGDVNGDGKADVLVSAPLADPAGVSNAGAVYVIYGKSSTGSVSTASLTGLGVRIAGSTAGEQFGLGDLDGGRDVNGDGKADVLVGSPLTDRSGRADVGSVTVFSNPSANVSADSALLRIVGAQAGDRLGSSAAFGDGTVIAGAPTADRGGKADVGEVVVVPVSSGTVDAASASVRMSGANADDKFGASVAAIGDFNGDGKGDIAIGAPFADPHGASSGSAYVVTTIASFSASSFTNGVRVDGGATGDQLGNSVAGADVNSDGKSDLIVGSYGAGHRGRTDSGSAYVIFGGTTGTVDVSALGGSGVVIDGPRAYCQAGVSVSGGDQNGDGIADVVVGGSLCGSDYQGMTTIVIGWDTPTPPVTPPTPPNPPVCVGGVDNNGDGVCDEIPNTPTTPVTPTPVTPSTPVVKKPVVPKRAVAKITGVGGCVKRSFVARVTGRNIKGTTFTVDGRTYKVFRKSAKTYKVKINPAQYRYGVHKVKAKVTFVSGATKRKQTLRFAFQRCKPKVVKPRTTG